MDIQYLGVNSLTLLGLIFQSTEVYFGSMHVQVLPSGVSTLPPR